LALDDVPESAGALAAPMPLDDGAYAAAAAGDLASLASVASAAPEGGQADILSLTASIATGYVSNNALPPEELPKLISTIHSTLRLLAADAAPGDDAGTTSPDQNSMTDAPATAPKRGRRKAAQATDTREA
jgi:hypothetical protein